MGCGSSKSVGVIEGTNVTKVIEKHEDNEKNEDHYYEDEDFDQVNEDIDHTVLNKIVLSKYETVASDDEDDDGYVSIVSVGRRETASDLGLENVPEFQPNFAEFPSHKTLQLENQRYWQWRQQYGITQSDQPSPPNLAKADVFVISKFAQLDKFAIEAPRNLLHRPVKEVVQYLTANCQSDLQKTRVLFRWCVAQNLAQLPKGDTGDTVLKRLEDIRNDMSSYSKLYTEMLTCANVENQLLRGAVKAAGYELGDVINLDASGNDWTAVKIDGEWRLIDVNFAARKQIGGSHGEWELIDDNGKGYTKVDDAPVGLTYEIDEFYFLTDPQEFIYNHFPRDSQWQLLARSITNEEFKDIAFLRSTFFELSLDVRAARRCVIHSPNGETILKFGVPNGMDRKFMYKMWKSSKDGIKADSIKDQQLSQFVFMEQREGILICTITFPLTGKYKFQLFAKDSSEEGQYYSGAAEYLIYCTKANPDFKALPTNTRQEWGPGQDTVKLGLKPITHPRGVIETYDGFVIIRFQMDQPVGLLAKLRDTKDNEKEHWVLHREENGEAVIYLRIQEKGTYALDIYAKPEGQEGLFPHVCTYLVVAADKMLDQLQFPSTANQQAGCTETGKQLRSLVPVTHKESYFTSQEGHEDIVFEYQPPLYFLTQLNLQSADDKEEIENHVFIQQQNNRVTFQTRFPKAGMYLLNLFAKQSEAEGSYTNVHKYVIYVPKAMEGCAPFPKTYSLWGEGCVVKGLDNGIVSGGDTLHVEATIPGAKKVAVIGSNWTHLEKNTEGAWEGDVVVDNDAETMQLSACYEENDTTFHTLTEYEIKTKKELAKIEEEKNLEAAKEEAKRKKEEEIRKKKEEEFLKIAKQLKQAIQSRNLAKLYKAVKLVEQNSYKQRLKEDYNAARNLIVSLERVAKLQRIVLKMNQATMAEIRSYSSPPEIVHQVITATLLLLSNNENITKDWKNCQALTNSNKLRKSVRLFDVNELHPEIASRAKSILQKFRLEDVAECSEGAACFYAWAVGMTEELNILKRNSVNKAKPADVKRQIDIFKGKR